MNYTGLEMLGVLTIIIVGFLAVDFFASLFRKPGMPKYKGPPPPKKEA